MTCRDFERTWNELIDGESIASRAPGSAGARRSLAQPAMVERERLLLEHAAQCAPCGQVSARYQALRRAIAVWGPPPTPSADLADRILAEFPATKPSAWARFGAARRTRPGARVLHALFPNELSILASVTAASLLLGLILVRSMDRQGPNDLKVMRHTTPVERGRMGDGDTQGGTVGARNLDVAWAEATAATWDLARTASEPAARISRQMLDAATATESSPARTDSVAGADSIAATVPVPSLNSLTPDTAAAGAMLRQVGDRLATGVRPLSNTARHAFGFLLAPALPKPEVPNSPPAQKGA